MSKIAPQYLPQLSAPFEIVVDRLNQEGVDNEMIDVNPEDLNPLQKIVFSDNIKTGEMEDDMPPIWVSKDNDIIDGHHRFYRALINKKPLKCVKIGLNKDNAVRVLNKIQDIYEYEEQKKLEEVVSQDYINFDNDIDSGINSDDFFNNLDTINLPEGNKSQQIGYRKDDINENSVIGNFFTLKPEENYNKYEISFDNLLDTTELGISFENNNPIDMLAKIWFPNVDFDEISKPYNIPVINIKNMAIANKAKKMGYDGIKYNDLMLQGLK